MHTALGFLPDHGEVEFILVLLGCLLPEAVDAVLLGVVVAGTKNIVLVFFEKAELSAVGELSALLVVATVERVSEGGGHGGREDRVSEKGKGARG